MKVIFLDCDGVLNSNQFLSGIPEAAATLELHVDPAAVLVLNKVIAKTKADVVISSSRRNQMPLAEIRGILRKHSFEGRVIGKTPRYLGPGKVRGDEIQAWLDEHPEVEGFVILDDDSDMAHLMAHLVQTSCQFGLREEHIESILAVLRMPPTHIE